ncbi:MAG: hypothetical protein Q4D55_01900 [Eubacteriales bacterium]|nr:hypothetical protein [Eubacteriales bacterium]
MKQKEHQPSREENPYHVNYEHYLDTNACTECTGLMYRTPEDREEWEAYQEVFDFTPEVPKRRKKETPSSLPDR